MTAGLLTIDALDVHVPVGIWTIDPAHSSIGSSVRHLMSKVRGTFEEFTGYVTTAEDPTDCSAAATIAMSSVNTANGMRDDDLRTANFFDVDRHRAYPRPYIYQRRCRLLRHAQQASINQPTFTCGPLTLRRYRPRPPR